MLLILKHRFRLGVLYDISINMQYYPCDLYGSALKDKCKISAFRLLLLANNVRIIHNVCIS